MPLLVALQALPLFFDDGFQSFQREYEEASVLLGRTIRFRESESGPPVEGRVISLGTDGKLYLSTHDGQSNTIRSYLGGEVCGVELVQGEFVNGSHGDSAV